MIRHLSVVAFYAVALMVTPCSGAQREKGGAYIKPLPYPSKAISKQDSLLVRAVLRKPSTFRGRRIEAPLKIINYFIARPWLAYRLAEQLQESPLSFSFYKEEGEWGMSAIGRQYELKQLSVDKKIKVLKFTFLFRFPLGIGLKTSGGGFIVIQTGQDSDDEVSLIDYDLYLVTGSGPIDKLTRSYPFIQDSFARADIELALSSFAMVVESVADDPESVAEDIKEADGIFSEKEVEEFEKLFINK